MASSSTSCSPEWLPLMAKMRRFVSHRLGAGINDEEEIRSHPFFRRIDWAKVQAKEIQPPYKPYISNERLGENFDPSFTNAKLTMTPSDQSVIANLNGNEFDGFSFVNPAFQVPGGAVI